MRAALLCLFLAGCQTSPSEVQICGMKPLGQNEAGILIVRMACARESE